MKVAVFGAGGVGGYYGGRLAQAGEDVHLVARGEHLEALRANGLRVESVFGDFAVDLPATDDPSSIGPCDVVLFCVKAYDTETAATSLDPLLRDDTAVVTLQNGVDNEDLLAAVVGREHVLGGVTQIFSTIGGPGLVQHTGGPARVVFGELDGRRTPRGAPRPAASERAEGVEATLSTAVQVPIWEKAAFICAQSGMTAGVRLPLGDIRAAPAAWAMYRRLVAEVCAVAEAEGVDLPEDAVDRWVGFAGELEADAYSSLHYDLTHDRPLELEALHGSVVRRADDHGVAVPMTEAIYAILEPWARRNAR